jgi:hypothetical protein
MKQINVVQGTFKGKEMLIDENIIKELLDRYGKYASPLTKN